MDATQRRTEMGPIGMLLGWTLAWVGTLAIASFGPALWGEGQPAFDVIAILVNLAAGVGWIVAHALYLRAVGELQRKVQLDALGLALGVGIVGGCAAVVASRADLIPIVPDVATMSVLMGVVYAVATVVGNLRYR
jgi:hypothetical protein